MHRFTKHSLLAALIISFSIPFSASTQQAKVKYLYKKEHLSIVQKGDALEVSARTMESKEYMETGGNAAHKQERIHSNSFTTLDHIEASVTYLNAKGKPKRLNIKEFNTESSAGRGVFFDDGKATSFSYPNVAPGTVTELSYKQTHTDPHLLTSFLFSDFIPVQSAEYRLEAPANVEIGYYLTGAQKDEVQFSKTMVGINQVYTWTAKDLRPYPIEDGSPGILYHATHLVVYIKSYTVDGKKVNVLSDYHGLHDWYSGLLKKRQLSDQSMIADLTTQVIGDEKDEMRKAQLIFNWVQRNIKYIAFEDGWEGFIPRSASSVCENRYGDCKDMSNLLHDMLVEAGLDARHTWIGTRTLPYSYQDNPTPSADNHMILTLMLKDTVLFLDATDEYTPFGIPPSHILGKEALINGKDGGEPILMTVPVKNGTRDLVVDSLWVSESQNELHGRGVRYLRSHDLSYFKHRYESAGQHKKEFVSNYMELGSNKFEMLDYQIREDTLAQQLVISYEFKLKDYIRKFGDKRYLNLHLDKPYSGLLVDTKNRSNAFSLRAPTSYRTYMEFTISDDMSLDRIPEGQHYSTPLGTVDVSYTRTGSRLVMDRRVSLDRMIIQKAEFEDWNQLINTISDQYSQSLEIHTL